MKNPCRHSPASIAGQAAEEEMEKAVKQSKGTGDSLGEGKLGLNGEVLVLKVILYVGVHFYQCTNQRKSTTWPISGE